MYEIRIHSRGGQGGVTAARLLAMAALHDGNYATACPFYGAERRGAPVVSFVRIDDRPIRIYSQIRSPDMIIVLDKSVMLTVDVVHGLKTGGRILINSTHKKEFAGYITNNVDLTGIALRENLVVAGSPILNTPVIGALAKTGIISADSAKSAIRGMFADERNIRAAEAAYAEAGA
ncbi:2-oxoacid:acceptor oxidoreductase family protein [Methanoregula sp.]|uniref:2-oxoacid:acceptor oxidoreductase family protein n=1 Tax=Methanoregula sp. TaxID=2052170 RepID=UPI0023710E42|nr:2-oxoacid:acceptor oxidoreductase family protein [Methanoregula sp.]MDD1685369.1 2-oxoacid:acceptor oxidoreductase family protein [Methanoregula sp.]